MARMSGILLTAIFPMWASVALVAQGAAHPKTAAIEGVPETVSRLDPESDPEPDSIESARYQDCVSSANDNQALLERCLLEQLADQQRNLDTILIERRSGPDASGGVALDEEQREWHLALESACNPEDLTCRIDRIVSRSGQLSADSGEIGPAHRVAAHPDEQGALHVRLGDAEVSMRSDGCRDLYRYICRNVALEITTSTVSGQRLQIEQVLFPGPSSPADITFYRGSLASGFVEGWHSIILSDLNADGYEDVMVRTGLEGTYGDPSYTYFLYDPDAGRLVESHALAEAIVGHSVSSVEDGRFRVWYRSGPCNRGEKTIDARGAVPQVVDGRDVDTCSQQTP